MNSTEQYIVAFDLDDVLCTRDSENGAVEKYRSCRPVQKMIDMCNRLYDDGCHIVIYTARGMNVFQKDVAAIYDNIYELTKAQLREWDVKHHELVMGKRHYDMLIDDKAIWSGALDSHVDVYTAIEYARTCNKNAKQK